MKVAPKYMNPKNKSAKTNSESRQEAKMKENGSTQVDP
jgi:hypothetical protein